MHTRGKVKHVYTKLWLFAPVVITGSIGVYLLYRATQLGPDVSLRAFLLGLLVLLCSITAGVNIHRLSRRRMYLNASDAAKILGDALEDARCTPHLRPVKDGRSSQ